MKNILVIRPGAIGDALLAFPVLKALREQYNCARITLVSNAQVLPLAQAWGVAEETCDFQDIRWSELFSSSGIHTSSMHDLLSQTDLAICWMRDPGGIIEHNLMASGVKHLIITPGRPSAGEHLHVIDYLAQTIGLPHMMSQFIQHSESQSTPVGARVDEGQLGGPLWSPVARVYNLSIDDLTISDYPQQMTLKTPDITTKRFIAIHPGSGSAEKCWPISRFAEIIKRLWNQNQPVLLLSGPADSGRVEDLLKLLSPLPTSEMFKMLTNIPLLEVAQHLQHSVCYLGNDSGITHLAAMLGIPTVAIFGPTDPQVWRPIGPFVTVLHEHSLEDLTVDMIMTSLYIYRKLT